MTLEPLSLPKKHSMAVFDKPAASPLATELTANWKKVRDLTPVRTPEFVGDKIPGKLKSKFVPAQIPKENVSPNRMVPEIQNELVDITNLPKPKIKKNFVPPLKLLDPTKINKEQSSNQNHILSLMDNQSKIINKRKRFGAGPKPINSSITIDNNQYSCDEQT